MYIHLHTHTRIYIYVYICVCVIFPPPQAPFNSGIFHDYRVLSSLSITPARWAPPQL